MERNIGSWKALVRVAVVVGFIGGAVAAGEGCDCNGTGPYVDANGLHCGDCPQYAYRCTDGSKDWAICAPDDLSAGMQCAWWTEKKECEGIGSGTAGGDGGSDDGGDSGGSLCASWDPDSYVAFNRTTGKYEIEEQLRTDLNANPLPLTECDSARMKMVSGGYYEFYNVGRDDLAVHLGFQEGDILKNVNGYDLVVPEDYLDALDALKSADEFEATVTRRGATVTLRYMVL